MERPDMSFSNKWHVLVNKHNTGRLWKSWMYDAMRAADEVARIVMLFEIERKGELPAIHQQCSHSKPEPIKDNHLVCCLGVKCQACPELLSLVDDSLKPGEQDMAKAWTCVAHILTTKVKNNFDDSEGYISTVGDIMFWSKVYESFETQGGEE